MEWRRAHLSELRYRNAIFDSYKSFLVVQPFLFAWAAAHISMEISDVRANDPHICISRCWLCWGVIDPIGSVFNLDMFSLFFVN